jgi:hypothetical protein
MTTKLQRRAELDRHRAETWEAERQAIVTQHYQAPSGQPCVIRTGWEGQTFPPSPKPGDDRPGVGTGMVVGGLLVGGLGLAALLISKIDGGGATLLLGVFAGVFFTSLPIVLMAWVRSQ